MKNNPKPSGAVRIDKVRKVSRIAKGCRNKDRETAKPDTEP